MYKIDYKFSDIYMYDKLDLDEIINGKVVIIYDVNVESYIEKYTKKHLSFRIEALEILKTLSTFSDICTYLTVNNVTRDYTIIAIGGGITLDVVGFVASSYMRGIDLVYVPTTLLAMVDASIGGKCGLNFMKKKNYIGSFYHPKAVHIFPKFLSTLKDDDISNGMAEVIKIAIVKDKEFFYELKGDININELIRKSIELKILVIEEDILDKGKRRILNFGHTIGHALEEISDYNLPHGFCVGIAMSYKLSNDVLDEILRKYGLFTRKDFDITPYKKTIIELVKYDKKNDDKINVSIVNEIGKGEVVSVQDINSIVEW